MGTTSMSKENLKAPAHNTVALLNFVFYSSVMVNMGFIFFDMSHFFEAVLISVLIYFNLFIYMLPAFISEMRDCEDCETIFWLNLLLGWTAVFWFICLFLAIFTDSFKRLK